MDIIGPYFGIRKVVSTISGWVVVEQGAEIVKTTFEYRKQLGLPACSLLIFMCFYNGININRAEHIKLKKIEKEIGQYKALLKRPMQSGFLFDSWPVIKPKNGGQDFDLVMMHWELIPFYIILIA